MNLGKDVERAIDGIKGILKSDAYIGRHFSPRYIAIKLLERDSEIEDSIMTTPNGNEILATRDRVLAKFEENTGEDICSQIANEKYGFIAGALAETMHEGEKRISDTTRILDAFITNKLFGFPLFFSVMFAIFWATFAIGKYPMEWIENGVSWLSSVVDTTMSEGPLKDLIVEGIIGGVGGVIVFLPNILILYFVYRSWKTPATCPGPLSLWIKSCTG